MRVWGIALIWLGMANTANCSTITLLCHGTMTANGKQVPINGETAVIDIENRFFKPPFYSGFPLTRVGENDLSFGSELATVSTWGSLDRVSGKLEMNVMTPQDRKALQAGGAAHFMVWLSAKCVPAQRMF